MSEADDPARAGAWQGLEDQGGCDDQAGAGAGGSRQIVKGRSRSGWNVGWWSDRSGREEVDLGRPEDGRDEVTGGAA